MKIALAGLFFFCLAHSAQAQPGRYLIQLRDKAQNPFSLSAPALFLSPRSIERRSRYHIVFDSTDLPVTPAYVDSIRGIQSVTILNVSKWLNQISVQTEDSTALNTINRFSFVQSATLIANRMQRSGNDPQEPVSRTKSTQGIQSVSTAAQVYDYGAAAAQITLHNGQFLHNIGLQGQGMILSFLDAGFYSYTSLKAFDSVNAENRVLGTWDFVAREQSVAEDHPHGMYCFSIIAANIPGIFVGTAPKASFYLFRSEDGASEYPIEEHNWVCAAERADSAGSDVLSSSLGYTLFNNPAFNHQYADMNGDNTIAATGADLAAKKGLLVVNAAGNEGDEPWKYIATPADGDSVLAVGAVTSKGMIAPFSSYGPSADGRVKPDVVSVGSNTIIQNTDNTIIAGNGTSFACPNMAGLATCLWQGFPEYNNAQIIDALRRSASTFETPNDRLGYGIPDLKKAVSLLLDDYATASVTGCKTINWTSKDVSSMRYEIERQKSGDTAFTKAGEQSGTGATFQTHHYQFTDPDTTTANTAARYRIRQIIDTSATAFSAFYIDTVDALPFLCTPVPPSENGIQIIPNPVQNSFYIKIDNGAAIADLRFVIMNAAGQTIHTAHTSKTAGLTVYPMKTNGLARGVYFLVVYNAGKRLAAKRFIKL